MLSELARRLAAFCCGAALVAGPALAQLAPSAVVQLVVPYPPGGPTDVAARALAPAMGKALQRTVIVQNVAGVSGGAAARKLLDAPADGQLVMVGDPNGTILAPLALAAVRTRPEDFVLLRNIGSLPYALVGRPTLAANTLDELVAAHRGPNGLSYGSTGVGSLNHLAGEDFRARTRLEMLHVPYKGGTPLLQDLISGQVDVGFVIMTDGVAGMVRAGQLKMYGLTAPARVEKWKEFPTVNEGKALEGFVYDLWAGLMVPKATPQATMAVLHQAAEAALEDPEVRAFIGRSGIVPLAHKQTLAQAAAGYEAEVSRYRRIAGSIKLVPQ